MPARIFRDIGVNNGDRFFARRVFTHSGRSTVVSIPNPVN
jgi:hypothetical protein